MYCVPECAAGAIESDQRISMEEKQTRHAALERKYGRRIFAAPKKKYLRGWNVLLPRTGDPQGMVREEWLRICWSKLNEQERTRAMRDVNAGGETWGVKFRK